MRELVLESIQCLKPFRGNRDRLRVELWVDGIHVRTRRRGMTAGTSWNLNESVLAQHMFRIHVFDEDTSAPIWLMHIPPGTNNQTKTQRVKGSGYDYKIRYRLASSSASAPVEQVKSVTVAGQKRWIRHYADQGCLDLLLASDDSSGYEGKWQQSDEPKKNYCGPTAGRNLLHWYGKSATYSALAKSMRTNTWDNAPLALLALDPFLGALWKVLTDNVIKAGSLPGDVRKTLATLHPGGLKLRYKEAKAAVLTDLTEQLRRGRPVLVLYSPSTWGLHWALVTGVYKEGNKVKVRLANGGNKTWADFRKGWSLDIPFDLGRSFLGTLGIKPFTMMYYS